MSGIPSEDTIDHTEIIFTALPALDADADATTENKTQGERSELPQHVEYLKNKLKLQQRRKKIISEEESRLQNLNRALANTESLNCETEQLNVQAAVLMGALNKLQHELENAKAEKDTLLNEIGSLKQESQAIKDNLRHSQDEAKTQSQLTAASNSQVQQLIESLQQQLQSLDSTQSHSQELNTDLADTLKLNQHQQTQIQETAGEFATVREEAREFIKRAQISKKDNENNARKLNQLIETNENKSRELEKLVASVSELKEELALERDKQTALNEKTRDQLNQTEKLNRQQATLIELGNSRIQELEQELEETLALNQKSQKKLLVTEGKLKDALQSHGKFQSAHEKALSLLKLNEKSLREAKTVVGDSKAQNSEFNSALHQFQQSSDQSQQLVLRTQTSLQKVLTRNELLERENRLLNERVNAMSAQKQLNTGTQFGEIDDVQLQEIGREPAQSGENKNSFYRLMTLLAIILPLSFIAHSVITNVGAEEITDSATPVSLLNSNRQLLESQTFTATGLDSADSLSSRLR